MFGDEKSNSKYFNSNWGIGSIAVGYLSIYTIKTEAEKPHEVYMELTFYGNHLAGGKKSDQMLAGFGSGENSIASIPVFSLPP